MVDGPGDDAGGVSVRGEIRRVAENVPRRVAVEVHLPVVVVGERDVRPLGVGQADLLGVVHDLRSFLVDRLPDLRGIGGGGAREVLLQSPRDALVLGVGFELSIGATDAVDEHPVPGVFLGEILPPPNLFHVQQRVAPLLPVPHSRQLVVPRVDLVRDRLHGHDVHRGALLPHRVRDSLRNPAVVGVFDDHQDPVELTPFHAVSGAGASAQFHVRVFAGVVGHLLLLDEFPGVRQEVVVPADLDVGIPGVRSRPFRGERAAVAHVAPLVVHDVPGFVVGVRGHPVTVVVRVILMPRVLVIDEFGLVHVADPGRGELVAVVPFLLQAERLEGGQPLDVVEDVSALVAHVIGDCSQGT